MKSWVTTVFSALLLLAAANPARAASAAEEAQALLAQGQAGEALKKLDAHLARNPQDAEARFARGLALVKLSRNDDAIRGFADLTRDYPQLPEPYNNLAVLYAQQGDYEKARDALEAALATHPSYATAHENLGDIYAALAGAAYNRALMLDQSNQSVRGKLNLVSQLDSAAGVAVAAAAAAPMPAPRPPPAAATPPPASAVVASAPPAAPVLSAPAVDSSALEQSALALLMAWTRAWSAQNLDAYFATYSSDFTPEGGLMRSAWETQRRDRISRPKRINVKAINPQVKDMGNGRARLTFTQEYESDAFSDSVRKVLELRQDGGGWTITREYTR